MRSFLRQCVPNDNAFANEACLYHVCSLYFYYLSLLPERRVSQHVFLTVPLNQLFHLEGGTNELACDE
jgi:hypothetical protein